MGKGLPKKVEDAAKKADDLIKKIQAGQDPNSAVPPAANTPPAPATPGLPASPANPPATVTPAPPATPPAVPAAPEPPATPPASAVPPACPECAKFQQKFSVLQGKYDAEVPRYAYRVQYLENQIADLNVQIGALRSATPPAPAPPASGAPANQPAASTSLLADTMKENREFQAFRENFPDIADMVLKTVDVAASKIHQDTAQKLTALEGNSIQDRQTKFAASLNEKHPGWQTMGQDPNWALWLNHKDRYSPKQRLDLLKEANQAMDAETVINLLDDFKAEMAKAGHPTASPPSNQAVPLFVTPPSGPGGTPVSPAPAGPEAVTRSYISKFYQDKVRGVYRGRDEEVAQIEAKINAAAAAGRVLNQ